MTDCMLLPTLATNEWRCSSFMNSPPSPAVDDGPRKGALGEVWAFLNRDVRTFK